MYWPRCSALWRFLEADEADPPLVGTGRTRHGRAFMLTPRGWAAALCGLTCATSAWLLSLPELAALGAAILVVVSCSLAWVWRPAGVQPDLHRRVTPISLMVGSVATVELSVHALRRSGTLLLTEHVDDGRRLHVWSPPLGAGQKSRGSFPLALPQRGVLRLGPLEVRRLDALGLASRRLDVGPSTSVNVWPQQVGAPRAGFTPGYGTATVSDTTVAAARWRPGGDEEFEGLRAYVAGDELRRVHWTASARGRGLMVRLSHPVGQSSPSLVVDDRSSSHSPESFELMLCCVASIIGPVGDERPPVRVRLLSSTPARSGVDALNVLAAAQLDQVPHAVTDWGSDTDIVITGATATVEGVSERVRILRVDPFGSPGAAVITDMAAIAHWPSLLVTVGQSHTSNPRAVVVRGTQ